MDMDKYLRWLFSVGYNFSSKFNQDLALSRE